MEASYESQAVHDYSADHDALQQKEERKKTVQNHTSTHKNETLECHGQDQQTVIDEFLFGKINESTISFLQCIQYNE